MSKEEIKKKILELRTDEEIVSFIKLRIEELESIPRKNGWSRIHSNF